MTAVRLTPLWSAVRCSNTRISFLAASASVPRTTVNYAVSRQASLTSVQQRLIHSSSKCLEQPQGTASLEKDLGEDEAEQSASFQGGHAQDSSNIPANLPWYLQEQQPKELENNPFAERQRIPELPNTPPPILQPLLKHISVDLGLDYLKLLDLRTLDPPPAFGANLLMIVGSARSEKHLNVSADRLCRWLRTNYKLRPHADGLLGRNELKLKLRRRNRRARIMTAAGGIPQTDPDDGISTGWICVDVGTVEGGLLPNTSMVPEEEDSFVGFRTGFKGAKIVVQMLTEAKREDVDLESLWQGMADSDKRRKEGERKAKAKVEAEAEASDDLDVWLQSKPHRRQEMKSPVAPSGHFQPQPRRSPASPLGNAQQVRRLHTTRPCSAELSSELEQAHPITYSEVESTARKATDAGAYRHLAHIQSLTPEQAMSALGSGENDQSSTEFLRSYHSSALIYRPFQFLRTRIEIHCYAILTGHPGYTRDRLLALLRECQACGHVLPADLLLHSLSACLTAHNVRLDSPERLRTPEQEARAILRRCLNYAKEIFELMEIHGYDILSYEVLKRYQEFVMYPIFSHPNHDLVPSDFYTQAQCTTRWDAEELILSYINEHRSEMLYQFLNALEIMYTPPPTETPGGYDTRLYKSLLVSHIREKEWDTLWELWHQLARRMLPRDAEMYAMMFQAMASGGKRKSVAMIIVDTVDEMEREVPAIVLENEPEVAETMRNALLSVGLDPTAGEPYSRYWKRIQMTLAKYNR